MSILYECESALCVLCVSLICFFLFSLLIFMQKVVSLMWVLVTFTVIWNHQKCCSGFCFCVFFVFIIHFSTYILVIKQKFNLGFESHKWNTFLSADVLLHKNLGVRCALCSIRYSLYAFSYCVFNLSNSNWDSFSGLNSAKEAVLLYYYAMIVSWLWQTVISILSGTLCLYTVHSSLYAIESNLKLHMVMAFNLFTHSYDKCSLIK